MKAVQLHDYGDAGQLLYENVATPEPGPGEVLVQVTATSVNPVDLKIRSGVMKNFMPIEFPAILGRDVAGVVVKAGANVTNPKPGQKVMGMVEHSYAEFLIARADTLTVIPDGLDIEEAGALPAVVTAGAQLAQRIQPKQGAVVLVTGAVGSVGRTAVYVAKQRGAQVIAGVKTEQKQKANSLGADQVVGIDNDEEISRLPNLDAIADTVDGETIGKLIPKLKAGAIFGSVVGKPKAVEGKDVRVEAVISNPEAAVLREMADAVRDGKLEIPIARKMKLSEVSEAHRLMEKGSPGGKVVLIAG